MFHANMRSTGSIKPSVRQRSTRMSVAKGGVAASPFGLGRKASRLSQKQSRRQRGPDRRRVRAINLKSQLCICFSSWCSVCFAYLWLIAIALTIVLLERSGPRTQGWRRLNPKTYSKDEQCLHLTKIGSVNPPQYQISQMQCKFGLCLCALCPIVSPCPIVLQ